MISHMARTRRIVSMLALGLRATTDMVTIAMSMTSSGCDAGGPLKADEGGGESSQPQGIFFAFNTPGNFHIRADSNLEHMALRSM